MHEAARCGGPKLPFGPLDVVLGEQSERATAALLGVAPRTVTRWRLDGLTWAQADELAVRIGLHPLEVWGTAWWDADS